MSISEKELTQDDVFEILSSPRRRYLLYHLRRAGKPMELIELAEHVAAWENDVDRDELTAQERKRVYVSLYQTHVPKLDDAGIVEHDSDSGIVALTGQAKMLDNYLEDEDDDIDWPYLYVGLSIVGSVLLTATVLGVGFFGSFSEGVVSVLIVGLFAVLALAHLIDRWRSKKTIPSEFQQGGPGSE